MDLLTRFGTSHDVRHASITPDLSVLALVVGSSVWSVKLQDYFRDHPDSLLIRSKLVGKASSGALSSPGTTVQGSRDHHQRLKGQSYRRNWLRKLGLMEQNVNEVDQPAAWYQLAGRFIVELFAGPNVHTQW